MTASEKAGRPAEPVAEPGREPGTGLSPSATAGDSPESDPLTGSIVAPDDPQQLEQEIERTREQLGQTVQELAARADVKSRARAKAAATAGRVKSTFVPNIENIKASLTSLASKVRGGTASSADFGSTSGMFDQLKTALGSPHRATRRCPGLAEPARTSATAILTGSSGGPHQS